MIEICAIGGYDEVGKNMTAVTVDGETVILDMGIYLESYIRCTEGEDAVKVSTKHLVEQGAIPDDSVISELRSQVALLIPTHAHLDHVGALPFMAQHYDAPILCTPYTKEVIEAMVQDNKFSLTNPIKAMAHNSRYKLKNITVEFINMTHSTPQTVTVALHTKYGTIVYANDFKFDAFPVLGKKADIASLQHLTNVVALVCDCTRAKEESKTPSERVAHQMLKDVLLGVNHEGRAIIVTTFSSHIARLKSIIEFGKHLNRKVVLLGRSLAKYVLAAERIDLVRFSQDAEIVGFPKQIQKKLKHIAEEKEKYLLVVTGHQGEPRSVLSRMLANEYAFRFTKDDCVVYSCTVIPTPINQENRERQEELLKQKDVRIFKDIHVSGHAAKEDLRDLLTFVRPQYLVPAHGDHDMKAALRDLALEMGYIKKDVILLHNGERFSITE